MERNLWGTDTEKSFFIESLKHFATPQQLFYKLGNEFFAYIPNNVSSGNQTLQSRNTLIGKYTERWCKDLFESIANDLNLYAINGVVCEELSLTPRSSADMAFCTTDSIVQKPENIKVLFEIKMSIVSNYLYDLNGNLNVVGDYKSHKGQPSLQRSDSMLKAIGKAINIRVSGSYGNRIPIIILGNSPITLSYSPKVDMLKASGIIQGFWSLYPNPCGSSFIHETEGKGFRTIDNYSTLKSISSELLNQDMIYFSSMLPKDRIGEIIKIANRESTNEQKADKFLQLIKGR